jgi:hypothetical protein
MPIAVFVMRINACSLDRHPDTGILQVLRVKIDFAVEFIKATKGMVDHHVFDFKADRRMDWVNMVGFNCQSGFIWIVHKIPPFFLDLE